MAIATTAYINLELLVVVVLLLEAAVLVACGFLFFDISACASKAPRRLDAQDTASFGAPLVLTENCPPLRSLCLRLSEGRERP